MNHTLYFKDEALYHTFKKQAEKVSSVSSALNEAIVLWLNKNNTWPKALKKMTKIQDDFRFESGRKTQLYKNRDLF